MPRLVEDVLETWRAAERLLEEMPSFDVDRETVVLEIERLRGLYQVLTKGGAPAATSAPSSEAALARSQALLDRVEGRLGGSEAARRAVSTIRGGPAET